MEDSRQWLSWERYVAGDAAETRDHRKVTDCMAIATKNGRQIVAVINNEDVVVCTSTGISKHLGTRWDLFMVPKATTRYIGIYGNPGNPRTTTMLYDTQQEALDMIEAMDKNAEYKVVTPVTIEI